MALPCDEGAAPGVPRGAEDGAATARDAPPSPAVLWRQLTLQFEDPALEKEFDRHYALRHRRWDRYGTAFHVACICTVLGRQQFEMSTHQRIVLGVGFLNELLPLLITVLPAKLYAPVRSWVVPSTFLCYIWLVPAIFSKWSVRQASRPPTAASLAYLFLVGSNARFLGTTALARPTLLRQRLPILLLSLPFQLVSNQVTCLHRSWNPAVEAFTARLATAIARGSVPFFPPSAELALRRVACVFSMNWLMIVLGIAVPQFILLKTECSMRGAFLMRAGRAPARLSRIVLSGWGAALALPIVLGSAFIISLFTAQMPLLFGLDVGGPGPAS